MSTSDENACDIMSTSDENACDIDSLYGTDVEMPYSGIRSFMRRKVQRNLNGVDVAVLGVPYDLSTCGRPGARFGPSEIRNISTQLSWGKVWPWGIDPFDHLAVIDYGDIVFQRGQPDTMIEAVSAHAKKIVASGTSILTLGGDHMVTYPVLKSVAEVHGPVALVHFDAHRDTLDSQYLDHGSFVHHAMKNQLISPEHSIQVGIRTCYDENDPITILHRPWVREHGVQSVADEIKRVVGNRPAYLTFDIDCIDPAFAPGTGTPVVDGLGSGEAIEIIRLLTDIDFVGMDIVEVAPPYDQSDITALLGASIALEYLCAKAQRKINRS